MEKGFTLIELLVVVLIIGILAAVALPQYNKAVIKSRTSALLPLLTATANAEEAYYIAAGTYTSHFADLDIDAPTNCTLQPHGGGIEEYYACGNDFILNVTSTGAVMISCCPNESSNAVNCMNNRTFRFGYVPNYSSDTNAGKWTCTVFKNSKIGQQICTSLPNFEITD